MARINIEEKWWIDPRRSALIRLLGGDEEKADGAAVRLWRLGQEYWKKDKGGIPIDSFEHLPYCSYLVQCSLAVVRDRSVFVRGCSEQFDWMTKKEDSARAAGKKSALVRRQKYGSSQPFPERPPNDRSNDPRTTSNGPNVAEPSSSSSSSSSSSFSKNHKSVGPSEDGPPHILDFESLYELYPKRSGSMRKAIGMQKLQQEVKTPEEFEELTRAVKNYASHIRNEKKEGTEFVKQWATFAYEWREFLDPMPDGQTMDWETLGKSIGAI